jgi:hypothetical protein
MFFEGMFLAILRWTSPASKPETPLHRSEVYRLSWRTKAIVALKAIVIYWILGALIYRRSRVRWLMHTCIFFSSIGLLILHIVPRVFLLTAEQSLFPGGPAWVWPMVYNFLFAMLIVGVAIASARRTFLKDVRVVSASVYNFLPLILIITVGVTGFTLANMELLGWQFYNYLYLVHYVTSYATIAFIPYGKFIHILAAPIVTLAHALHEIQMMETAD